MLTFRAQLSDLSPEQLQLSLGLKAIMKERGLAPQENSSLKEALPPFLRHASIVRLGKAKVGRIFYRDGGVFCRVRMNLV